MIEFSQALSTASDYVSEATKASQSVAALITSVTATKSALDNFRDVFFKKRQSDLTELGVCDLINRTENIGTSTDVKSVSGIIAPIMDFKGEEEANYKQVSTRIQRDIADLKIPTTENEFLAINSKEWLLYGCSLQSTTEDRIQVLSLIESEEANSLPVLVSKRYYERNLNDPNILYGMNSTVSGLLVPVDDSGLIAMLGAKNAKKLTLGGSRKVLIADEDLINDLQLDFSLKPDVHFNKKKCFFLGFLWAVYMNIRTNEIVPIYEYGNIGDQSGFILLAEKLIHQIEFFKKRIWNELEKAPGERQYKLLVCYNDQLEDRIKSTFQEDDFFDSRADLLYGCREEIIEKLF